MGPLQEFEKLLRQYITEYGRNRVTLDRQIVGAICDLAENGTEWVSTYNWGGTQRVLAEKLKQALELSEAWSKELVHGLKPSIVLFISLVPELTDEELIAVVERVPQGPEHTVHDSSKVMEGVRLLQNALDEERMWLSN